MLTLALSICIGAVGAWTAVAMVRVNKALCGKGADAKPPTGAEAASLLKVWGVRHGVRTAAALAALGAALAAAGPLARA